MDYFGLGYQYFRKPPDELYKEYDLYQTKPCIAADSRRGMNETTEKPLKLFMFLTEDL